MAIEFIRNIITSGYNLSKINDNFEKIETALQDGLSRLGHSPNQMQADIDMNSNDLLNVDKLDVNIITYQGSTLAPSSVVVTDAMIKSEYDPTNVGADVFNRSNHTGTQPISSITSLQQSLDARVRGYSTKNELKAASIISPVAFLMSDSDDDGMFELVTYSNYSSLAAVDTYEGWLIRSTADNTVAWLRKDTNVRPEFFGAVGDGVTNDVAAFRLSLAVALNLGENITLSSKTYLWNLSTAEVWDLTAFAQKGLVVQGESLANSTINISGITAGVGWRVKSDVDWFDLVFRDFRVVSNYDGCIFALGNDDFSGPLNVAQFDSFGVFNSSNTANNEAVRINYVVNSSFIQCRFNCYANGLGTNTGTALRARQMAFCTFVNGSFGNADVGVWFKDGYNYGNSFFSVDIENVDYCVKQDSSSSGANTFVGGQFSLWTAYAISSSGSLSNAGLNFINCNFTTTVNLLDPNNLVRVKIEDWNTVTTPTMPTTGTVVTNTTGKNVVVIIWGGTVSQDTWNGFSFGISNTNPRTYVLAPGDTISITYSAAPTWVWRRLV